jgi:outer membrane protein TolC
MRHSLMVLCWIVLAVAARAQARELALDSCYRLATQNYPLIRQKELISKTREYTVENASRGYLPQLVLSGQATYQSQTISFPFKIPGVDLPVYSKDQYKVLAELDQSIYDGGTIKYRKELTKAEEGIQLQGLAVDLYALRDRINQLYFGILLIDEQLKQNALQDTDFQNGADKAQAAVNNGTALRSSVDELKAEILLTAEARTELMASRKAYTDMLSYFINQPMDEQVQLIKPSSLGSSTEIHRPELALFDYQIKSVDIQEKELKTNYLPKLGAYVQGAYSRPTLNFISNDFGFWALGGVRFSWSISGLYTLKNDRRLLNINRKNIDIQKETFLFNTHLSLTQENDQVNKYLALLNQDHQIIDLRLSVKNAAAAQLENGVITAHDYVTQVNAENQARQSLILHEIQYLQSQYTAKNTSGN